MINWAALHTICESRILFYEDAIETGSRYGSIRTEFKYVRLVPRYKRLLDFISQRANSVKP